MATPDMLCLAGGFDAVGGAGRREKDGGETGVMTGTGTGVSTGSDGTAGTEGIRGMGGGGTADCGRSRSRLRFSWPRGVGIGTGVWEAVAVKLAVVTGVATVVVGPVGRSCGSPEAEANPDLDAVPDAPVPPPVGPAAAGA